MADGVEVSWQELISLWRTSESLTGQDVMQETIENFETPKVCSILALVVSCIVAQGRE